MNNDFDSGYLLIADFDGDGQSEAGISGVPHVALYDPECDADPVPPMCDSAGIRWHAPIETTVTVGTPVSFDFEGDGAAELVYNDSCFLRILDGLDGHLKAIWPTSRDYGQGNAIVADVDGDGATEIVVPASDNAAHERSPYPFPLAHPCVSPDPVSGTAPEIRSGIFVLRSAEEAWRPSRPIWNQMTYHVTNIGDDGAIPQVEEASWQTHNTWRHQFDPTADPRRAPDLTVSEVVANRIDPCTTVELRATVHNRGALTIGAGVFVAFFEGAPEAGGRLLCRAQTTGRLAPGGREEVMCWGFAVNAGAATIVAAADLEGRSTEVGRSRQAECEEGNNRASVGVAACE